MRVPLQHVKSCKYCTDYKGQPKPISPENLYRAKRMPDGSFKCETCQIEELKDRIVSVTPNSIRARELVAENRREVDKHNRGVDRLNRDAGRQLMKRKSYKYGRQ